MHYLFLIKIICENLCTVFEKGKKKHYAKQYKEVHEYFE